MIFSWQSQNFRNLDTSPSMISKFSKISSEIRGSFCGMASRASIRVFFNPDPWPGPCQTSPFLMVFIFCYLATIRYLFALIVFRCCCLPFLPFRIQWAFIFHQHAAKHSASDFFDGKRKTPPLGRRVTRWCIDYSKNRSNWCFSWHDRS